MATHVSKRTELKVIDAVRRAHTPLTTAEISILISKSFETTRHAIAQAGLVPVDGSFPTEWKIGGAEEAKAVPSKHSGATYQVSATDQKITIEAWNGSREALGASIAELEITYKTKPKELAKKLGTVAGNIAALAYELEAVSARPEWYDLLSERDDN